MDINSTVNLPKTDFPMRASLPAREPGMLADFENRKIYARLMEKNQGKPKFILHDGPPYANGNIHIGTSLNKILKDFIVRYKNMTGFYSPYVPGWDTHGLPIESAILKSKKVKRSELSISEFRDMCKDFAYDFLDKQRTQFKRLGGIGDWDNPYITLLPEFEGHQVKVFGAMAEKGYIYKGLKPVYWCPNDETALAEAEIEYADDPCMAIFVKFRVHDDKGKLSVFGDLSKMSFVIWTTTTWTLPGNLAISLNADFQYVLMQVPSGEIYIVAKDLAPAVAKAAGIESYEILATLPGSEFEFMTASHPFHDRDSIVLNGDHVTLEAGSGCVHTAPGFGADDFNICRFYDREKGTSIGVIVPVNSRGVMTDEAEMFAGMHYTKANEAILENLRETGALLVGEKINHSYPHCWRCKSPIIYRATEQWFCSVDAIKEAAIAACEGIKWNPEWGKERMIGMIAERSDWCISRQRVWGVPIPIFYCAKCGKDIVTPETIDRVSDLFTKHGSNIWFDLEADELVPEGFTCPFCGHDHFTKESDIMDVWFDSGSTHAAVCAVRPELHYPADIYLEGGDQYRGWFQSSMLTSIATNGIAPYRQIITHGWTVDGDGKAMHKSLGNAVAPEEIIKEYGADILRLWVSSADYRQDMRISKDILKQLSSNYLKIRNTAKYILGNLGGFDPDKAIPFDQMVALDQWAIFRFNRLVKRIRESYDRYEYHSISHGLHNFCAVDMSNFYLDVIKDRLYCDAMDSYSRLSACSAIYYILDGMTRMLAPLLAFTSEEIWSQMPHRSGDDAESVLFNPMVAYDPALDFDVETEAKWTAILELRDDVNKAIELARAEKIVGKPMDADVTIALTAEGKAAFEAIKDANFGEYFIIASLKVAESVDGVAGEKFPGVTVKVEASQTPKCPRCWNHTEHPDIQELCPRCAQVIAGLE